MRSYDLYPDGHVEDETFLHRVDRPTSRAGQAVVASAVEVASVYSADEAAAGTVWAAERPIGFAVAEHAAHLAEAELELVSTNLS